MQKMKPWSFLHTMRKLPKLPLVLSKVVRTPSAEERKSVCCLSAQKVLIVDSIWTYSAVVSSYLFPQVCKLSLLI